MRGIAILSPVRCLCGVRERRFGESAEGHVGRAAPSRTGGFVQAVAPVLRSARQYRAAAGQAKPFSEALEILRPLATDHPDQTDVRFLLGLAASRGPSNPRSGTKNGSRSWTRPSRRSGPS